MDVSKAEKARLGIFLLGTSAFLAVVLFIMVGKKIFTKKVPYYTKLIESVSGLELGTPVKQNGVEVGNISFINTDSSDISKSVVHFEVSQGTPMKADMNSARPPMMTTPTKMVAIDTADDSSSWASSALSFFFSVRG